MTRLVFLKILTLAVLPLLIIGGFTLYFILPAPVVTEQAREQNTTLSEEHKPVQHTETIGTSVQGRDITVTSFGDGPTQLLFVGGMHGGYEWNSSLLAYDMIEQLTEQPDMIPDNVTVNIIPTLNPDGTYLTLGTEGSFEYTDVPNPAKRNASGRFNANGVDLNRNFDCKWAPKSTWRGKVVSAGTKAFSEPEAQALRTFVGKVRPEAVVFWHSKANNVYASECHNGVLAETITLMNTYANAAQYGKVESFDAYPITGDAEGWLASIGIPAVTVEMETAERTDWLRNLAGVKAVLQMYTKF